MEEGKESWVDWFLSQKCNQCFIKIDHSFITDNFNVYGLRQKVPRFKEAIAMICGPYYETDDEDLVYQATRLYGLLHARFITTVNGLEKMKAKYISGSFQNCPRFLCEGFQCLPYGCSEVEGEGTLKMYCPNCGDVYDPCASYFNKIDGAYFGPSWVHIFLQHVPRFVPKAPPRVYVPRIFGFKLSKQAGLPNKEDEEDQHEE